MKILASSQMKALGALVVAVLSAVLIITVGHPQQASAATNQFKGVNWADTRDNYNTGWVIPDGLSASDSYSAVYSIASDTVNTATALR